MQPRFVTAHLLSGDYPAIVTRENDGGTLNITVFADGDLVYRNGVSEYVREPDDDDEDRVGMWSN